MNNLTNVTNSQGGDATMTSRQIAELTGTRHKHALVKIKSIISRIDNEGFTEANFILSEYKDTRGKTYPEITMTEAGKDLILSKYNFITPNKVNAWKAKDEYVFGEEIVNNLFHGYEIIPQFELFGGLDWYIPELKLAIEFDEEQHFIGGELRKECVERQRRVEQALGCRFIRYKKGGRE